MTVARFVTVDVLVEVTVAVSVEVTVDVTVDGGGGTRMLLPFCSTVVLAPPTSPPAFPSTTNVCVPVGTS